LRQSVLDHPGSFFGGWDPRQRFLRHLPDAGRVLEIGCGRGQNCALLRRLHPQIEIHGLDLLAAPEVPDFIRYQRVNVEQEPLPYPDAYFDGILLTHVLEHLHQPTKLCAEIQRLLKPGGYLYVEAPNYTSVFAPSFGMGRGQHQPFNFYDDLEHLRPYTKQALFEFVEQCGLRILQVGSTRNWLRFPLDLLLFPLALLQGDRPQAVRRFWNIWGWCIFAIGTRQALAKNDKNP